MRWHILCYYTNTYSFLTRTGEQQHVCWVVGKPKPWDWKPTNQREIQVFAFWAMGCQGTQEKITLNLESGKPGLREICFGTQIFISGCGWWKSSQWNSLGTIFIVLSPHSALSDKKKKNLFSDPSGSRTKNRHSCHNLY